MKIEKDRVVTMDFELRDSESKVLESSKDDGPLVYLHGSGFLFPRLEQLLAGQEKGFELQQDFLAKDAFGEYDPTLHFSIDRSQFDDGTKIEVGLEFMADINQIQRYCRVAGIKGDSVEVEANHELAGEDISITLKVLDVRAASPEELDHGHAHYDGMEHH